MTFHKRNFTLVEFLSLLARIIAEGWNDDNVGSYFGGQVSHNFFV